MKQILWCILLVVIGVFAAFAQLDRQSRYQSELTVLVPQNMRYFAQANVTDAALTREDSASALDEARILVARRPVAGEHLRMLAQAQLLGGETAAGTQTLQLASQRGWRDTPTQVAMLGLAQGAGNDAEMVRRYFAIWVKADDRKQLQPWAKTAFASPKARKEATRILNVKGRWQSAFLRDGLRDLPPEYARQITARIRTRLD